MTHNPGSDVGLEDPDDAEIRLAWQVDRKGDRRPTNPDGSARTVPIPRELALILARHKLASSQTTPESFVLATRSGSPLSQRNVARALRKARRLMGDLLSGQERDQRAIALGSAGW